MKRLYKGLIPFILSTSLLFTACTPAPEEAVYNSSAHPNQDAAILKPYQYCLDLIKPTAYSNILGLNPEPGSYISIIGMEEEQPFWNTVQIGAQAAIDEINEELGYTGSDKITFQYSAPSTPDLIDEQINILDAELARFPIAIAIATLDATAFKVQFDQAIENGIPVVAFDSNNQYTNLSTLVATNNEAASSTAATNLASMMEEKGEVLVIAHDSTSSTGLTRQASISETLTSNYPNITNVTVLSLDDLDAPRLEMAKQLHPDISETIIVPNDESTPSTPLDDIASTDGDIDPATGENTQLNPELKEIADNISVEELISHILTTQPNINGIITTNESSSQRIISILDDISVDYDNLSIVSIDGSEYQVSAMKDGKIDGLIIQNPYGIGYATIIASIRAATNQGNESMIDTGFTWVTEDNLDNPALQDIFYK